MLSAFRPVILIHHLIAALEDARPDSLTWLDAASHGLTRPDQINTALETAPAAPPCILTFYQKAEATLIGLCSGPHACMHAMKGG